MQGLSTSRKVIRFGLYEVDLALQELRKSGVKVKLHEQPFQILALLLERPGEIVTREEIQKRLWDSNTFVDFDIGLNSAVKKLRQALGDESDNPRFIETLYRRGYRFLAPVQSEPMSAAAFPAIPSNGEARAVGALRSEAQTVSKPSGGESSRRLWFSFATLALLALGSLVGYGIRPPVLPRVTGYQEITHDGRQKYDLATDGERLYIAETGSGHFEIAQVSSAGGETSFLSTPFTNVMLGGIVPDGSALLIGDFHGTDKQAQVWFLPLPTGAPRRLETVVAASLAPEPDGRKIIFSDGKAIYEAAVDGTNLKKLFSTNGSAYNIGVSPDAAHICFNLTNTDTGTSTLWMADRDGSNLHPLFPASTDTHDSTGRWTPDGRYLLFERYRGGHSNIWVLPWSKSWLGHDPKPLQLTNGPLDFGIPLPSRDGKKIFAVGARPRTEMVRFDGQSGFKPYMNDLSITDLDFSRDGQWITYVSVPDRSLWRSRMDGSQRLQLTDPGKIRASLPRWSPDGKQIAFMGRTNTSNWRAYLISSNGGPFQDLVPKASSGFDPNWMPDGKSIVLSLANLGPTAQGVSLLDLQTGKTSDLPDSGLYFSPRPSPDGKLIAAITTDSGTLMLFDVATQRWTELVKLPIGYPSWSRDGRYIYFDSILSEDPAFYRLRISDRKLERLVSLSGIRRFWGEMAEWSGLAPDDSLLLTRDASNQEVYAIDWTPD